MENFLQTNNFKNNYILVINEWFKLSYYFNHLRFGCEDTCWFAIRFLADWKFYDVAKCSNSPNRRIFMDKFYY